MLRRRSLCATPLFAPLALFALVGGFVGESEAAPAAAQRTGEQIYKQLCASCHGADGQGSKEYSEPLAGDRSVADLAAVIDKTMPEGDPKKCVGEDAKKVAAYIYDKFYSPVAQARLRPARVDLARLTVRQYQNALADLVGSFRAPPAPAPGEGLKGQYFRTRRFQNNDRQLERIDPVVAFDFGEKSPVAEKIEDHEFSIRWEGTILAPDSGDYEFVLRTDQAVRLWVNSLKTPLIDGNVRSGNDLEQRGSIRLLGGRAYAIRLDFSKSVQGVNDDKKKKKSQAASIQLSWKAPGRAEEIIPSRVLSPGRASEVFVLTTKFPPDDRSMGYERGTSISSEWYDAATEASFETAAFIADRLPELAGAKEGDPEREKKARDFCRRFVEKAFRRPLTPEEKTAFVDVPFDSKDPEDVPVADAVKRVVLLALASPRFLYREVGGDPKDPNHTAARLAWALWDSPPDRILSDAAAQGKLVTEAQLTAQAERMLADPRAKAKLRDFFTQWLQLARITDLSKDPHKFKEFDDAVQSDLRASLELFVDSVLWSERSDFRELLLADKLLVNRRLAKFYDAPLPAPPVVVAAAKKEEPKPADAKPADKKDDKAPAADPKKEEAKKPSDAKKDEPKKEGDKKGESPKPEAPDLRVDGVAQVLPAANDPFQKAAPKSGLQAGVLTHPYLLAGFAYAEESSPIHRGVFISRSVLGRALRPPPEAVSPLAPDLHPSLTNRQRVALQTKAESCAVCHSMINPLGFPLENFDAVGRFRAAEKGKPIDASGVYQTKAGAKIAFKGPQELAKFLAGSEEVHTAFVEQMFHNLVKQPIRAYGNDESAKLRKAFVDDGFHMRKLAVRIAVAAALPPGTSPQPASTAAKPAVPVQAASTPAKPPATATPASTTSAKKPGETPSQPKPASPAKKPDAPPATKPNEKPQAAPATKKAEGAAPAKPNEKPSAKPDDKAKAATPPAKKP